MADEISASDYGKIVRENAELKAQVERLTGEVTRKGDRLKKLQGQLEDVTAERDKHAADIAEMDRLAAEYEAEPPDAKDKRIAELEREIKGRDVRGMFDKAAKGKVREDALEAAWKLAGIDLEGDHSDETIGEALGSLVESNAFLKPDPAATGSRGADDSGKPGANGLRPAAQPGPGFQRGSTNAPAASSHPHPLVASAAAYIDQTGRTANPNRIA